MASGRPTILAIDGVGRELLEQAQGGTFVEPENPQALVEAILHLYHNKQILEHLGLNARRYVATHFDRKEIAENLRVILENIANSK